MSWLEFFAPGSYVVIIIGLLLRHPRLICLLHKFRQHISHAASENMPVAAPEPDLLS